VSTPLSTQLPDATSDSVPQKGVLQRAMLLILALTLATTCLLTSAPAGITEAGSKPWNRNSILRIITELTNLDYQFPTARGTEIKFYTQGLGAAAVLICAVGAWFLRTRGDLDEEPSSLPVEAPRSFSWLKGISPVVWAQIAMLLYVGWSIFSGLWAVWPEAAVYEGLRGLMVALMAIGLARCLTRDSASRGALLMTIVLIVSAGLGVWYYYERNPLQRLKYPIGNPIFLAACLLPAWTLIPVIGGSILMRARQKTGAFEISSRRWIGLGALVAGLILTAWAFVLADSRGPGVALVLGIVLTAVLLSSGRRRWGIIGACLIIFVALIAVRRGPVAWILSRPDTIRGRLFSWHYALDIFRDRPDIGRGQGAYMLIAQSLSRPDAENDPLAFPGELIGHAHNEYLEIMADLGVVGLLLFLAAIVMTMRAVRVAWRQESSANFRLLLAGLTAGWMCILFESVTDVALRMPGLPVIFYATWGLLWALCRSDEEWSCRIRPKLVRAAGLGAAIVAGAGILWLATQDWQSALADPPIAKFASQLQWDKALSSALQAAEHRLYLEGRLSALYQASRVARDASAHRVGQLRGTVERGAADTRNQASVLRLVQEDVRAFDEFFTLGVGMAARFMNVCPFYPNVSGFASDQWLMRAQLMEIQDQVGPIGLTVTKEDPLTQARMWLEYEYAADRLRPEIGLRLLRLSEDRPIRDRLDLLRIPMRSGAIEPSVEPALAILMQDPKFGGAIDGMLSYAQPAAQGVQPWPDPYAPESLRLAALAHKLRGDFETAAALSGEAAKLLDQIRDRFPYNSSYAMADEAGYLLLADPTKANRAVGAMQQAIARWPATGDRRIMDGFRRLLAVYWLAAGNEAEAMRAVFADSTRSPGAAVQGLAPARTCAGPGLATRSDRCGDRHAGAGTGSDRGGESRST
jgi:O-antigen ligase